MATAHFVPPSELPSLGTSQHIRRERHEGLFRQQTRREAMLGCSVEEGNPSALTKVQ